MTEQEELEYLKNEILLDPHVPLDQKIRCRNCLDINIKQAAEKEARCKVKSGNDALKNCSMEPLVFEIWE